MLDLGTLKLGIKVDTDSAKSQLGEVSNEVEKTGATCNGLATKAKTMIKAFVAVYAVKALVSIGKAALDAYANFEQLEGGVNKIFGDDAQTVIANAQKAYQTAGISANTYMEQVTSFSSSLLQSLGGDTKKAAEVADMAVQDMADNANTFGTSMESIQNAYQGFAKQNYTMLDNLKLGYGGTKEEMQRLLTDAEKISGVKYDISNLNDVYQAIHVIQTELNITGTTAKEAASTMEGSINSMKAAWENLLTAFGSGDGVAEAVTAFVGTLGNVVNNAIPIILNIVRGIIDAILMAIPQLFNGGLGDAIGGIIQGLVEYVPAFLQNVAEMITQVADSIGEGDNAQKLIDSGVDLVAKLIVGIVQNVPAIIEAIGKLVIAIVKKFAEINPFEIGKSIISGLLDGLKSVWQSVVNWVSEKVEWIKSKLTGAKESAGHRIGLSEVPYDGYVATLHKGETVLTAAETNQYEKTLNGIANSILGGISASNAMNETTQTVNLIVELGGVKVAEQIYKLNKQGALALG